MTTDTLVADVIGAAGGEVVGRVRLQKIFYLLDQLGLRSGLKYNYHHYGPYSSELSSAVADATAFKLVSERVERRSDGVGFSIYSSCEPPSQLVGALNSEFVASALAKMQQSSSTVLELAATIHWLKEVEKIPDWHSELVRRKGVKTEGGRAEAAVRLLEDLQL